MCYNNNLIINYNPSLVSKMLKRNI